MATAPIAPGGAPGNAPAFTTAAVRWIPAVLAVGLAGVLFAGTFVRLLGLWDRDPSYSHGYLVPLITAGLAVIAYRRAGPPVRGDTRFGLIGIGFGVACQFAATVLQWPPLSFLGLVCVLRGLLVCTGGRAWAARFTFPLIFLAFMFPLPVTWTTYAALVLQDVVARVSASVIGLFAVCERVGHTLRIAGMDQSLVVAAECSGLGQIVAFVAFASALGYIYRRPAWYWATLILAAVPIAVLANTLRVCLMNFGAYRYGTGWMSGTLHDAPALFSLPVGIGMFLLLDYVLDRLTTPPADAAATAPSPAAPPPVVPVATPGGVRAGAGLPAAAAVLVVAVVGQLALATHLQSAAELSYPPMVGPLSDIPTAVTDPKTGELLWRGQDLSPSADAIRAKLPFHADDILVRGYQNAAGVGAQLYMVHSRAGEDRKHHPEICIRDVSGAPEDLSFRAQVPLDAGGAAAQRFRFRTGADRGIVVYYWHYTPTPTPDATRTRLQTLHLRLGVAAPSVTAQLSVGAEDPRALAAVERVLLPAIHAGAGRVLPPGTVAGCNRLPIALERR